MRLEDVVVGEKYLIVGSVVNCYPVGTVVEVIGFHKGVLGCTTFCDCVDDKGLEQGVLPKELKKI